MELVTALGPPPSPARTGPAVGPVVRVGVVQHRWYADADRVAAELGFRHRDSGAFYRAIPFAALQAGSPPVVWGGCRPGGRRR